MDKPVEAIERFRAWMAFRGHFDAGIDGKQIVAYLDSIPDGAVPVVWPKELTRERLEQMAHGVEVARVARMDPYLTYAQDALLALAAIAPQRKKRVVNLWMCPHISRDPIGKPGDWIGEPELGWRKVAGPIEIDE